MNGLILPEAIIEAIVAQARAAAPLEACGLLSGRGSQVLAHYEMTNADHSPEHFTLLPQEQFAVAKQIRAAGQELLAVYHSHPSSSARPSSEDLRLAFAPDIYYVIVSLVAQPAERVRAFRIQGEEVIEILVTIATVVATAQS